MIQVADRPGQDRSERHGAHARLRRFRRDGGRQPRRADRPAARAGAALPGSSDHPAAAPERGVETWQRLDRGFPNLSRSCAKARRCRGSWRRRLLVHTNCTTGVEAVALDRPSFCLVPADNPANRRYLANQVNPVMRTTEDVIAARSRASWPIRSSCYRFRDDRALPRLHVVRRASGWAPSRSIRDRGVRRRPWRLERGVERDQRLAPDAGLSLASAGQERPRRACFRRST